MHAFIKMLVTCSVIMSAIAMITLLVLPVVSRKYSPKARYYIWLIIIVGYVVPFRPQLDLSFLSGNLSVIQPAMTLPILTEQIVFSTPDGQALQQNDSLWDKEQIKIPIYLIVGTLWLTGVVFVVMYNIYRYFRFAKLVNRWAEDISEERIVLLLENLKADMGIVRPISIQKTSCIVSPMMVGFITPKILLPSSNFYDDELRFILKHELIHYKRKDLWYKFLVLTATTIHWFNPFIYVVSNIIDITCEMSCDAEVVESTSSDIRLRYTETILGVIRDQARVKTALSTNFYGGKKGMKKRIFTIMDTTKKRTGTAMVCVALIATMGASTIFASSTSAVAKSNQAVAQVQNEEKVYQAVSDGLQLTINRIERENDSIYLFATLVDTTEKRLSLSAAEKEEMSMTPGFFFPIEKRYEADSVIQMTGSSVLGYNQENESVEFMLMGKVDVTKVAGEAPIIFEGLMVRGVQYEVDWEFQIPIPEESWVIPKAFAIDKSVPLCGIEIDGYFRISPDGSISIIGQTKNVTQFDSKNLTSIELVYQNGAKENLKVLDFVSEPIDLEQLRQFAQQYQYAEIADSKGNTHNARVVFQRVSSDNPFTLEEVQNLKSLNVNGLVIPLNVE